MSGNIVFSWLGPGDVKRNGDKIGPVADALLQLKPDKAVLLYPQGSFEEGSDSAEAYRGFLTDKLRNDSIKTEVAVRPVEYYDESYEGAYTQANKIILEYDKQDARLTALITGGMMQQGLIWVFLASKYRLKLIACPNNEPVQQLLVPIEPKFFTSDNRPLANCQVFAWVAKPQNSRSHHENGAVAAWLDRYSSATASIRLLVDASPDQKALLEQAIAQDCPIADFKLANKCKIIQDAKSRIADTEYEISTVNFTDLAGIYYEALDFVERRLDTSLQSVFLVNGGSKENNLAWVLLKILYPEARLIAAWKTGLEKLSPDQLENPDKISLMLNQTADWFAGKGAGDALPHNYTDQTEHHWDQIHSIWPWLKWVRNEALFNTLKFSCGAHSYANRRSNDPYGPCLGTVVLVMGLALQNVQKSCPEFTDCIQRGIGADWPDCLQDCLPPISLKSVSGAINSQQYQVLLADFYRFFDCILWDKNAIGYMTLSSVRVDEGNNRQQLILCFNGPLVSGFKTSMDRNHFGDTGRAFKDLQKTLECWENLSVSLDEDNGSLVVLKG